MNRLREIRSFQDGQSLPKGENKRRMETPRWIDEREVSQITGVAVQTLRNWRHRGVGFPYCKVGPKGTMVRYLYDDVIRVMSERRINPRE